LINEAEAGMGADGMCEGNGGFGKRPKMGEKLENQARELAVIIYG